MYVFIYVYILYIGRERDRERDKKRQGAIGEVMMYWTTLTLRLSIS